MNIKSIGSKIKGNPTMVEGTVYSMLIICSISHFLNDMIQSIIPSIYPIVKDKFDFSFAQIGIITLVFQMTSSILQPFTGLYADKHPRPYALSVGMCFTLIGLLMLAFSENYLLILLSVSIVGLGSSVFHPTASRVAQLASGGRKSLAQSIFQVGGNGGSAIGPLLAALIILPFGQHAISWFALAALLAKRKENALNEWVFYNPCNPNLPMNPASAYQKLHTILKNAELPRIRFHDLRHTFATHATKGGVDPKTLSGILGHTNASFTLDTYTHVTGDMQKNAAAIVGGMVKKLKLEDE